MRSRLHLFLLLLLTLATIPAEAAELGSISGTVKTGDGSTLPGVVVTVKGPLLPVGRSTTTGDDGRFNFQRLLPGEYELTADLPGVGTTQRRAVVAVDNDTQAELILNPSLTEEITVTAATPAIDVRSTEVQTNVTQEVLRDLPLTRDYKGLFQLAPGVSENNRLTPNAGGSRLDNTYLVDGLNITNPHYGDILPNISELDIEEVNIKRAGITAEFGRTAGMVVNAVTRSGTNQFEGRARVEYAPSGWVAANEDRSVQNTNDREVPGANLGGPIVRDRAWFFASANFPSATTTDRRNTLGAVPDLEEQTEEYFGKVTASPWANQFLAGSVRSRETTRDNANVTASAHPSVATDEATEYLLASGAWSWNFRADSFVDLKVNHGEEDNGIDPVTNLGYRPVFDPAHPERAGRFTTTSDILVGGGTVAGQLVGGNDLGINNQDFERDEVRASYQTLQTWGDVDHDLRLGVTWEENSERLERRANGWGAVTWNPTTRQFTASFVSQQPPHTGVAEALGVFLQDELTFGQRTTVTAGVLVNRDEYFGEALGATPGSKDKVKILTFDWDQQIQPRLGVAFVPTPVLGDKVFVNYGRYNNTENKSLVRAASPSRIFTTRATFDANGNLLSEVPAANTQNKRIDAGLDPMYTDEFAAGYSRPFGTAWWAELWGMYRDTGDIFEDVSADGLGNGPFRVAQLPDAYRRYKAVTLQVSRRSVGDRLMRLALDASYTWSRLEGNWDIDFGGDSPFHNSSFIEDGPGVLITDNRDGILRGDRTHVAKVFARIVPVERVSVGTYVRYQSGGAWEARGLPDANVSSSSHFRYLEPAGSRRMSDWLNVDLLASYELPVAGIGIEIEGRLLNVFDEQVELSVDDRLIVGRASAPNNPNFGKGTTFSAPRAFVASAIVRY